VSLAARFPEIRQRVGTTKNLRMRNEKVSRSLRRIRRNSDHRNNGICAGHVLLCHGVDTVKEERHAYLAIVIFAIRQAPTVADLERWSKTVLNSDEHKAHRSYFGIVDGTPDRAAILTALKERKAELLLESDIAA
jgi:hypothetical protein